MIPLTPITINAVEATALSMHTGTFYDRDDNEHLYRLTTWLSPIIDAVKRNQGDPDRQALIQNLPQMSAYAALWAQRLDTEL